VSVIVKDSCPRRAPLDLSWYELRIHSRFSFSSACCSLTGALAGFQFEHNDLGNSDGEGTTFNPALLVSISNGSRCFVGEVVAGGKKRVTEVRRLHIYFVQSFRLRSNPGECDRTAVCHKRKHTFSCLSYHIVDQQARSHQTNSSAPVRPAFLRTFWETSEGEEILVKVVPRAEAPW
jgi:hypothetical protein